MPAQKKHPSTRARRNKTAGAATLPARQLSVVPDPVDYSGLKVVELRELIDERNDGRDDEQRISKGGSKAQLVERLHADDVRAADPTPDLPGRIEGWTDQTRAWWADVWSSPMSNEWDESDIHNVFICALLFDDMWTAESAKARKDAAGEFRLQCARLGLDPYARRRLEWQIEAAEGAKDQGNQRRQRQQQGQSTGRQRKKDPRSGLATG